MNALVKREGYFLAFLLNANSKQRQCLIRSITTQQLKVLIEVVFNVLRGYGTLNEKDITELQKHRGKFYQLVRKQVSRRERIRLIDKHFDIILKLLRGIKSRLSVQWLEN